MADIAVFAYTHLGEDAGFDFTEYPALSAWIARVKAAAGALPPVHPYSIDPDAPACWRSPSRAGSRVGAQHHSFVLAVLWRVEKNS